MTKLRSSRTAPIRSTSASATCDAGSTARARLARSSPKPPVDCAPLSTRVRSSRLPEHWKAGTAPNASPDHHRQPEREGEHHAVEARLVEPYDVARYQRRHSAEHDDRGGEPQPAAAQAQHHALGQELAHDPAPAGAQRRADCQRALATHSPYRSNPATLMQAISRTSAVAAVSAAKAGRYSPTISYRSGITRTRFCESPEGRPPAPPAGSRSAAPSMRCRMARTSVAACPAETPSRSRPSTTVALSG